MSNYYELGRVGSRDFLAAQQNIDASYRNLMDSMNTAQSSTYGPQNWWRIAGMRNAIAGPYKSDSLNTKLAAAKQWLKDRK